MYKRQHQTDLQIENILGESQPSQFSNHEHRILSVFDVQFSLNSF